VKSSKNKESSSTAADSHQQRDSAVEKLSSSVSDNKALDNAGKRSKGKKVKDETAGLSSKTATAALKQDDAPQQVMLCF